MGWFGRGEGEGSRRERLERERAGWLMAAREESWGRATAVLGSAGDGGSLSDLSVVEWQQPCRLQRH